MSRGVRVFCIRPATDNGIGVVAAALVTAANKLARVRSVSVRVSVLQTPDESLGLENVQAFCDRKVLFALQVVRQAIAGHILVFDHVHLAKPLLWLPRRYWPPVMIFAHGSESWRHVRESSKKIFARADLVLCNSDYTKRRMEQHGVSGNLQSCPLGLSRAHALMLQTEMQKSKASALTFADGNSRPLGDKIILMIGRMLVEERRKGHWQMLSAMPAILDSHPDAQLVMAGTGNDRQNLLDYANQLNCGHAVSGPGFVSQNLLQRLLEGCAVFALPSQQEGFGLVYLEAMNAAKPCIACENDGGAEVVVHGRTGLLVDAPPEAQALSQALHKLLENPEWARLLGENGRKHLHQHFTFEMFQERLMSALETLKR